MESLLVSTGVVALAEIGDKTQRPAFIQIHELCRTRHRDHDARFFELLRQVMPDREQRKQRLEAALP